MTPNDSPFCGCPLYGIRVRTERWRERNAPLCWRLNTVLVPVLTQARRAPLLCYHGPCQWDAMRMKRIMTAGQLCTMRRWLAAQQVARQAGTRRCLHRLGKWREGGGGGGKSLENERHSP